MSDPNKNILTSEDFPARETAPAEIKTPAEAAETAPEEVKTEAAVPAPEEVKAEAPAEPEEPALPEKFVPVDAEFDDEDDYIEPDEDDFEDDEDDFIETEYDDEDDFIEINPEGEDDFVVDELDEEDTFVEVPVRRNPNSSFYMENEFPEDRRVKKKKKHSVAKTIGKIFLGLIIALLVAYLGISAFFTKHFYYDTKINGRDFSMRTEEDVQNYMARQVDDYKLTLYEVNGKEEVIRGSDIGISYRKSTAIGRELKKQNPFMWPKAFWDPTKIKVDVGVDYDEEKLSSTLKNLKCMNKNNWTKPKNARPVYNGKRFTIKKEVYGSTLVKSEFRKAVRNAIIGFNPTLNLEENGCYKKPHFTSTSKKVKKARKLMNKYIRASITYKFDDNTEVVDRDVIKDWITCNPRNMEVTYDEGKVDAYVARLAQKYDTIDKTRKFKARDGKVYKVKPGTYGWQINQEAEIAALKESIRAGERTEKEPAYIQTARSHGARDWGSTYAEVSISQQHMWYIRKGKVVFEADVVTGLPTPKKATPTGMHQCLEKAQNKVLTGERMPNGQPEYRTPVAYWMRVTWSGVGFHTATWQPFFGGNRYTYAGSHGCINMSYSDSQALYGYIEVGDAVIIHE